MNTIDRMTSTESGARHLPARRALVDEVYDAVLELLMDHVIEPGERASIDGIARELDVSPTPVREALTRLESEGLVVKKALRGYTAAPLLDADGLAQLFAMRRLLEPPAASLAASRIGPDEITELERLAVEMHRTGEAAQTGSERFHDYRAFADRDADFHRLIAANSGNALLLDAIVRLRAHLHLYRLYFAHGIAEETADEHELILDALRRRDTAAAEAAMLAHIGHSHERISSGLAANDAQRA